MDNEETKILNKEEVATEQPSEEEPKEDLQETILKIKEGYETKMLKQKEMYEKRIEERNKVINQLLLEGDANKPKASIVDKINEKRVQQTRKW